MQRSATPCGVYVFHFGPDQQPATGTSICWDATSRGAAGAWRKSKTHAKTGLTYSSFHYAQAAYTSSVGIKGCCGVASGVATGGHATPLSKICCPLHSRICSLQGSRRNQYIPQRLQRRTHAAAFGQMDTQSTQYTASTCANDSRGHALEWR